MFWLGDEGVYGLYLWVRELLICDNIFSLVSRVEKDVLKYDIEKVIIYLDLEKSLELFDGISFSYFILLFKIVVEGWF